MNIIYENERKIESYLSHELNTRYYAVLSYRNSNKATYVCRKYHISISSLSRWNRKFYGTKESLRDKFHYTRYIMDALDKVRIRLQKGYGYNSKEY